MIITVPALILACIFTCNSALSLRGNIVEEGQNNVDGRVPFSYPLFKQCDPTWAGDLMDTKTICDVGCLMSSTAMGLNGSLIFINDVATDPQTLNQWLKANNGYDGSNDLIETQVPLIDPERIAWPEDGMHKTNDLPYATVAEYIEKGRIVIGNVNSGHHFVLLTGYSVDNDTFIVNDPGYDSNTYSYKYDIVGYRIFDMKREAKVLN